MQYDLKRMVILVTRANTGIGKAASLQLAKYGATVVVACLSSARGFQALREVQQAANSLQVYLMDVYMSSKPSIRNFVHAFFQRNQRLDVMIHNATNFEHAQKKPVLTEDNIETVFATNHQGPFLITQLLLDVLKSSVPSRMLAAASEGLINYPLLDIELDNLHGERKFGVQQA